MNIIRIIQFNTILKKTLLFALLTSALLAISCAGTNDVKRPRKTIKIDFGQLKAYIDKGQYDKAVAEANNILILMPKNAMMYDIRGDIHFERGEYDKAIADYSKAIALIPHKASFYNSRGYTYTRKEQYDKAIADHSRAIELDPENALFYAQRGHTRYLKGDYDRAITDANKAIELLKHPEGYHVRGHALLMRGEHDKAISDFSKAIKLTKDVEYPFLYMCRGAAYHDIGAYGKAYEDFQKAIELEPTNDSYYNELAWMLATNPDARYRDGQKAVELSKEAIKRTNLKSQKALYLDTLAAAYAETGRFESAVNTQRWALSLLHETKADSDLIEKCNKRLAYYKAQKPWREN